MKEKFETIIREALPGFWFEVGDWKGLGDDYITIKIAPTNHQMSAGNGRPQMVSLWLEVDTMRLEPQMFGGNGGQCIYREPNKEDPREKYLAMARVKVPFRRPEGTEAAVLRALQRFCVMYKETLKANAATLLYRDIVNYSELLK